MKKAFTIGFYIGTVGVDGDTAKISDLLSQMTSTGTGPAIALGTHHYNVRNLSTYNNGTSYSGVFAKLRSDDVPHIGKSLGDEREIDLGDDEGLIEKNHFIYYRKNELMIYQSNGHGSTISVFEKYFTHIGGEAVSFNPVLKFDAIQRMMIADLEPRQIELSIARPTNPELYPNDDWSKSTFELMNGVGGARMYMRISAPGRGASKEHLIDRVKYAASALVESGCAKVARITMDGMEHPIDLITDRLQARVEVEMNGRYPNTQSIFSQMRQAKEEFNGELASYFGEDAAID